jgi:hypothetical protein
MKKFIFLAACALFTFSSFTAVNESPGTKQKEMQKAPAGASFSAQGSYTWYDVWGYACNGDVIYFPSLTQTYDYHGVENNNMFMIQGVNKWYGTGTSIYTGETWTADFETKLREKYPFTNGALVIKNKIQNSFVSESGFVDAFSLSYHLTFNANGALTADKSKLEIVCE